MRGSAAVLVLVCSCAPAHSAPVGPSQAPAGFWDTWGDGQGELTGYQLAQPRYGELRQGTVVLVVVTETLDSDELVKSDQNQGTAVLKLNEARDFRTGLYDYNGMLTAWLPLDGSGPRGLPVRARFSLQEWCGHAFEDLRVLGGGTSMRSTVDSYFQGESGAHTLDLASGALVADVMPVLVRDLTGELVAPGTSRSVAWVPGSLERRLLHRALAAVPATLSRTAETTLMDGTLGHITSVETAGGTWAWHVASDSAHSLVGWTGPDGERAVRTGTVRRAYWQDHGEGAEVLRKDLGIPVQ